MMAEELVQRSDIFGAATTVPETLEIKGFLFIFCVKNVVWQEKIVLF
jgi:hypothetical protein